jgi:hypothetical protein
VLRGASRRPRPSQHLQHQESGEAPQQGSNGDADAVADAAADADADADAAADAAAAADADAAASAAPHAGGGNPVARVAGALARADAIPVFRARYTYGEAGPAPPLRVAIEAVRC